MVRDGITEGIAIMRHPSNRWYPSKWFTRDYGFFSPTPMYWSEKGGIDLPKSEPLSLSYRVIVHTGGSQKAKIADLFEEYRKTRPNAIHRGKEAGEDKAADGRDDG